MLACFWSQTTEFICGFDGALTVWVPRAYSDLNTAQPVFCKWAFLVQRPCSAFPLRQNKGQLWQLYGLLSGCWHSRLTDGLPRWGHVPNFTKEAHSGHVFWLLFMRFVLAHESQSNHAGENLKDHLIYPLHHHHSPHTFLMGKWRLIGSLSMNNHNIQHSKIFQYQEIIIKNRCLFCIN